MTRDPGALALAIAFHAFSEKTVARSGVCRQEIESLLVDPVISVSPC